MQIPRTQIPRTQCRAFADLRLALFVAFAGFGRFRFVRLLELHRLLELDFGVKLGE